MRKSGGDAYVTALSPRSVNVVVVLYFVILPANVCLFSRMMTCVCVSVLLYIFRNTSVHTHTRLVTAYLNFKMLCRFSVSVAPVFSIVFLYN